jgi:hypothetical protein
MPRTAPALAILFLLAACSASPPPATESHAGRTQGISPSAEGGASGTPHPSAPSGADGSIELENEFAAGGSGLSVAEALESAVSQPVLVNGFLVRDADGGIWFCDELGDVEPPACGHPALWVTNFPADEAVFEPENARAVGAQTEGGVTWISNQQLFGVVHPAP